MKKKKALLTTLSISTILTSTVFIAACAQFGSSSELPHSNGDEISVNTKIKSNFGAPSVNAPNNQPKIQNQPGQNIPNPGNPNQPNTPATKPATPSEAPGLDGVNVVPDFRRTSEHLITKDQKIRYVAFGDSLTAGFDGTLDKDYQGKKEADNDISGLSYPSFLARMLNDNNRIQSYNNYAISGATLVNWVDILNFKRRNGTSRSIGALKHFFGPNYEEVTNKIIENVKNANLITLTLGANDFLHLLIETLQKENIVEEIAKLQDASYGYGAFIEKIKKILDNTVKVMIERLADFTAQLKQLAPNANINFISYPLPLLRLKHMFDNLLGDSVKRFNFKFSEFLLDQINGSVKTVAHRNDINYINAFNQDFWEKNANNLTGLFFDIHPNTHGYKKLAMDIYLKITNNYLKPNEYKKLGNFDFTKKYINSDASSSAYQIEVGDYDATVKKHLFSSSDEYIDHVTKYEQAVAKIKSPDNYGFRIQHLAHDYKFLVLGFFDIVTQSNLYKEIDPTSSFRNFLFKDKAKRLNELVDWFLDSNYLQLVLSKAEKFLTNVIKNDPTKPVTLENVKEAFLTSIQNQDALLILVKSFVKSDFLAKYGEEFKNILAVLLPGKAGDIIHDFFVKYAPPFLKKAIPAITLSEKEFSDVLGKVITKQDLSSVLLTIVETVSKEREDLSNVNSFSDLFAKFLTKPAVVTQLKLLTKKILGNPETEKIIIPIIKSFIDKPQISWLFAGVKNTDLLIKNVVDLYRNLDSTLNFSHDIVGSIVENIKKHGLDTSKWDIPGELFKIISAKWNNNLEGKIVNLVKTLASSKLVNENTEDLKTLIKNVFTHFKDNKQLADFIFKLIPVSQRESIQKLLGDKDKISEVLSFVIKTPEFEHIFNTIVNNLVGKLSSFKDVTSLDQIFSIALKNIDLTQIKTDVNGLITKLISNKTFQNIIYTVSKNILSQKLGINPIDPKVDKLLLDFSNQLPEFIKLIGFQKTIVDSLFKNLEEAKKSEKPFEKINNVPTEIINALVAQITKDPFAFISKIINFKALADNREGLVELVKAVYKSVVPKLNIKELFNKLVAPYKNDPTISKWIDFDELSEFSPKLVNNVNFQNIALKGIEYLILNVDNWKDNVTNFDTFIKYILNSADLKKSISGDLKQLANFLVDNIDQFSKTINKTAIEFLKTLGVDLSAELTPNITQKAVNIFIETLKQQKLYNNILDSLLLNFTSINNKTELTKQITEVVKTNAQKVVFVYVKNLINSDLVDSNKDAFKAIFAKLIDQLLNQKNIKSILSIKSLETKAQEYGITNYENVKTEIAKILSSDDLKAKYKNITNAILDNFQLLKNKTSVTEFLDVIVKIPAVNENLNLIIKDILNKVLKNKEFKPTLRNIAIKLTSSDDVKWLFEGITNKQAFFDSIIDDLAKLSEKYKLTDKISDAVSETIKSVPLSANPKTLFETVLEKLKSSFTDERTNVNIIKDVIASGTVKNHLPDIKQVLKNIINRLGNNDKFVSRVVEFIPSVQLTKINEYLSNDDLKTLIKATFSDSQLSTLIANILQQINVEKIDLSSANTYNDLVKQIFQKISFISNKDVVKQIVGNILNNAQAKPVLAKGLANFLKVYLGLSGDEFTKLSTDIINNLVPTLKSLGIYDDIFTTTLTKLDSIKSSDNPLTSLSEIPNSILQKILEKIQQKPVEFIQTLLKSSIITENKKAVIDIFDKTISLALTDENNAKIAKKVVDILKTNPNTTAILSYVDLDEVQKLLAGILSDQNFKAILKNSLVNILNNEQIKTKTYKTLEEFVLDTISASNLFDDSIQIEALLDKFVNAQYLSNTLLKTINKLLSDNGLSSITITKKLADDIANNIIPISRKLNLINIILGSLKATLSDSTTIKGWLNSSIEKFKKDFDFTQFANVKAILDSKILARNYEEVKAIISKVWQWFKANKLEALISQVINKNLDNSFDKAEISKLVVTISNDSNVTDLINLLSNELINNWDAYKDANSYERLVQLAFHNEAFVAKTKPIVVALIKSVVNNDVAKKEISKIIKKFLEKPEYAKIFDGITDKEAFIANLLGIFNTVDKHVKIADKLFDGFVNQIKTRGFGLSIPGLISDTLSAIKDVFNVDTKDKVFNLLIDLLNTKFVKDNADDVKRVIENIFEIAKKDDSTITSIIKTIPASTKASINKYVDDQTFENIIKFVLRNDHFKSIVNNFISLIFDNVDTLKTAKNLNDLIKKTLAIINVDSLKTDVKGLLNDVLTNADSKQYIKNVLRTTLSSWNVDVSDKQVSDAINALVDNLKPIIDSLNLVDPLLDKVFAKFKEASTSEDPFQTLSSISVEISSFLEQKIFESPSKFIKQIFDNPVLKSNADGLVKIAQGGFRYFNKSGKIYEFISNYLNKLDPKNPLFSNISIENLKSLIKLALNNEHFAKLADSTISYLIRNHQWVDALDSKNFETIIFAIFKIPNYVDSNKEEFKLFIKSLVTSTDFTNVLTKVFDEFATANGLDASIPNRNEFIHSLATNAISILEKTGIYNGVIDDLFASLKTSTSFEQVITALKASVTKRFDFKNFEIVKQIIASPFFKDQGSTLKILVSKLYSSFIKNDKLIKSWIVNSVKNLIPKEYNIDEATLTKAIKAALNLPETGEFINLLTANIVDNIDKFKAANSYDDLLKIFVSQQPFMEASKVKLNAIFNKLLESDDVLTLLSKVAVGELNKLPDQWLLKGIVNPQQFIKGLIKSLVSVNKSFNLVSTSIDFVIDEAKKNGTQIDFSKIFAALITSVKNQLSGNWETKILAFIKDFTKGELFSDANAKANLQTLIKNIFDYYKKDSRLATLIYNAIPSAAVAKFQEFIPKEKLITLFNKILNDPALKAISDDIVSYAVDNIAQFQSANNLIDIFKLFLLPKERTQRLIGHLTTLVVNTFAQKETKELMRNAATHFLKFIGANVTDSIDNAIYNITDDFGGLLKRIGLIDRVVNGFVDSLKQGSNFTDVFNNLLNNTLSSLNLSSFEFISKILGDSVVRVNRNGLKDLLNAIVDNLLKSDSKFGEIVSITNVSKLFTSGLQVDSEKVNKMIVAIFRNNYFLNIIKIFISEIVDNNETYAASKSWEEALNKFFNSSSSNSIKTELKKWLRYTLQDTTGDFANGLAEVVSGLMIKSGYNIQESNKALISRVIKNMFSKLSETSEFDTIIDNVFNSIKKVNFTNAKDSAAAFTEAITSGLLSIITTDDGSALSLDKIFNQAALVEKLVNAIGYDDYTNFINLLFESSDLRSKTGVYRFIENIINPPKPGSGGGSGSDKKTLSFSVDVYIWEYFKKGEDFISKLFIPLYDRLFYYAANGNYNQGDRNKSSIDQYKAMYRIATTLLWIIYNKMYDKSLTFFFWNATGSTVESLVNAGMQKAYDIAWAKYGEKIKRQLGERSSDVQKYNQLGITFYPGNWFYSKSWTYDPTYVFGDRKDTTRNSNYWRNQMLAYIWYSRSNPGDRFSNKTKSQVLFESLEKGYLGQPQLPNDKAY